MEKKYALYLGYQLVVVVKQIDDETVLIDDGKKQFEAESYELDYDKDKIQKKLKLEAYKNLL